MIAAAFRHEVWLMPPSVSRARNLSSGVLPSWGARLRFVSPSFASGSVNPGSPGDARALWRRTYQAVAACCKKASRGAKRALSRERPSGSDFGGGSKTTAIAPEGAPLTDEEWEMVEPIIPQRRPTGRTYNDHRTVLGGILWVARTGSSPGGRCRKSWANGRPPTGATSCG
jgi:hypothetical protein